MRSRYTAYALQMVDYLVQTTHPDKRSAALRRELDLSINQVNWVQLKVLNVSGGGTRDKVGKVSFVASYYADGSHAEMEERSRFRRYKGEWKYWDDAG